MGCNTMAIGRPTQNSMTAASCTSSCSDLGPVDPLDKNKLGPRLHRDKVRMQVRDYILNMLGAPVLKIELDEQNIDFCIDQAMKIVEEYAGREYFSYHTFRTVPGKSVYEMPPDIGVIRNVFYKETDHFAFEASDLGGVIPIEYFTGFGSGGSAAGGGIYTPNFPIWGQAGEWSLYKSYSTMYARMSSQLGGWEWVGDLNHIKLYPIPCGGQLAIVHYMQKMKDWPQVTEAIQEGALSYAKEVCGRIRGKYVSPPGPGGGMALDGAALLAEAKEEREKWKEELITKFGDLPYISLA